MNFNFNNSQHIQQNSSSINLPQPQDNVVMVEFLFFYKPHNDFQIYHITCEEISFEMISRLLTNNNYLTHNNIQLNNSHLFYYQQPDDKKIYKVICEIVSYDYIVRMLNKINYDNELNLNEQQQVEFSQELKDNLELHLKHDLINYLTPFNI
ncbi:hypothetical protein C1646_762715 [Rhizophagus diaphanus]|nr:hypothetical protein C1646_762715 [Rhizophagus diaphanus] [Rhizophagus sp. MUCL 43196]